MFIKVTFVSAPNHKLTSVYDKVKGSDIVTNCLTCGEFHSPPAESAMFRDVSCIIYWLYTTHSIQIKIVIEGKLPNPHFSL